MNVADARGLTFECQPGCGYCCTAAPLVAPQEAPALGALVVRGEDGTLRIPMRQHACGALGSADRRCTVYEARPLVCHLYPYQVHAGRRVQATISFGCPGVQEAHATPHGDTEGDNAAHPFGVANHAEDGARRAVEIALAQPGAADMVARAKSTFVEFDRRMREWGHAATPDKLRSAFAPALDTLARPESLPPFLAGIAAGDLALDARDAVASLFDAEGDEAMDLGELLAEAARDAFDGNAEVLWVEPGHAWTVPRMVGDEVELRRGDAVARFDPASVPTDWSDEAGGVLAAYLRRLTQRDQTEGAACWLVDASGYQATPAAAYARVLGEAALQVTLRAGLAAAEAGAVEVTAELAWRGVRAYETSYHSLPTLGSIL